MGLVLLFCRFHCEYNPLDKTTIVKIEVNKVFVAYLKKKLFTNEKKALKQSKKRANKQEKKKNLYKIQEGSKKDLKTNNEGYIKNNSR